MLALRNYVGTTKLSIGFVGGGSRKSAVDYKQRMLVGSALVICVVIPRFSECKPWRLAGNRYLEKCLVRADWQVQICTGLINFSHFNVKCCDEDFSVIKIEKIYSNKITVCRLGKRG
jgi:hypothetical protein